MEIRRDTSRRSATAMIEDHKATRDTAIRREEIRQAEVKLKIEMVKIFNEIILPDISDKTLSACEKDGKVLVIEDGEGIIAELTLEKDFDKDHVVVFSGFAEQFIVDGIRKWKAELKKAFYTILPDMRHYAFDKSKEVMLRLYTIQVIK